MVVLPQPLLAIPQHRVVIPLLAQAGNVSDWLPRPIRSVPRGVAPLPVPRLPANLGSPTDLPPPPSGVSAPVGSTWVSPGNSLPPLGKPDCGGLPATQGIALMGGYACLTVPTTGEADAISPAKLQSPRGCGDVPGTRRVGVPGGFICVGS